MKEDIGCAGTLIRPAVPQDGERIATLMREGVSDTVRRITIMCSPRLGRFVADELAAGGAQEYVVAVFDGRVMGTSAWRHADGSLHLDHLYVAPELRGRGIGSALVLDGLRRIRRSGESCLLLDVFDDTPRAVAWYRSWNMRQEQEFAWIQLPLPAGGPRSGRDLPSEWAEAQARQARYGFSQFTLSTATGTYRVGRLGERLFRCGTFGILDDVAALEELARFDPQRQLLCVGPATEVPIVVLRSGSIVARSERLTAPCEDVMACLESKVRRSS